MGGDAVHALQAKVYEANMALAKSGLVLFTWGNVSQIDEKREIFYIKPSGVSYDALKQEDIVGVCLKTGEVVCGSLAPSSDTPTHLALYRAFENVGGIVHTHSPHATVWAQAGRALPCFGTTHADTFYGQVPCTRRMTQAEIEGAYELETGHVIVEAFIGKNPMDTPAVLVHGHGPFAWGKSAHQAVENAIILENCAKMAAGTLAVNPAAQPIDQVLIDRHFLRKHGENAYYGQKSKA